VIDRPTAPRLGRRVRPWLLVALLVLPPLTLLPRLTAGGEDLARLRNALVFDHAPRSAFEWAPSALPAGWLTETAAPHPEFVRSVQALRLDDAADDWQRAVMLAGHLLASGPVRDTGAVQAGLVETLHAIVERGEGYCADFVRAYRGLAVAAGLPVRSWAFAFQGFGGEGHIWVEVWSRQLGRWQLLDLYNNSAFYLDDSSTALSALELRDALLAKRTGLRRERLVPGVRWGYEDENKAWAYYRRGLEQWYLVWGMNPFAKDTLMPALNRGTPARAVGALLTIAAGLQPNAVALETAGNGDAIRTMLGLRMHALGALALSASAIAGLLALGLCRVLSPRRRSG
jgi:hypothetical protein